MSFEPILVKKGDKSKVLIIYTGGTLGMVFDDNLKTLVPFKFTETLIKLPELSLLEPEIHLVSFDRPIDSSDVNTSIYLRLASIIKKEYNNYNGFVVIHGTDTMAFTASALSFLIQNPKKPIVFTGSQLPIGIPRSDARENLMSSIEIAAAKIDNKVLLPEICICFNGRLLRGNRARKRESSQFDAFDSENYPHLAEIGVFIDYNFRHIRYVEGETRFYNSLSDKISVLTLFPGISENIVKKQFLNETIDAVILMTFGSGNAPSAKWFLDAVEDGIDCGKHVLNITQCTGGKVVMGKYANSQKLQDLGVISGSDMTLEASLAKMMWALENDKKNIRKIFNENIAGEITLS